MISIAVRTGIAVVLVASVLAPLRAEDAAPAFDARVARRITSAEVKRDRDRGDKMIILDTRGSLRDAVAHGAVPVTDDRIESWAKGIPKDSLIVAYCT